MYRPPFGPITAKLDTFTTPHFAEFVKLVMYGANPFSFEDRDLLNLAKTAADAHSWIYQQKANVITAGLGRAGRRAANSAAFNM